jgi:hypothetical protein
MSADNGTYILQTFGPEFRIAHVNAIDNIYGSWDPQSNSWTSNSSMVLDTFGDSEVYTDLQEAIDVANEVEEKLTSEYGVCMISDFQELKFLDLIEGKKEDGTPLSD